MIPAIDQIRCVVCSLIRSTVNIAPTSFEFAHQMRKKKREFALGLDCRVTELLYDRIVLKGVLEIAFDPIGLSSGKIAVEADIDGEVCKLLIRKALVHWITTLFQKARYNSE